MGKGRRLTKREIKSLLRTDGARTDLIFEDEENRERVTRRLDRLSETNREWNNAGKRPVDKPLLDALPGLVKRFREIQATLPGLAHQKKFKEWAAAHNKVWAFEQWCAPVISALEAKAKLKMDPLDHGRLITALKAALEQLNPKPA